MTLSQMRSVPPGAERNRYLPLLHLADDSAAQIASYYQLGDLYALDDAAGGPVAIVLAIAQPNGVVELKSVAVATPLQGQGFGRELVSRGARRGQAEWRAACDCWHQQLQHRTARVLSTRRFPGVEGRARFLQPRPRLPERA